MFIGVRFFSFQNVKNKWLIKVSQKTCKNSLKNVMSYPAMPHQISNVSFNVLFKSKNTIRILQGHIREYPKSIGIDMYPTQILNPFILEYSDFEGEERV